MIHDILSVAEDTGAVKIIDTDSLFIHLGECEDLKGDIENIEKYINSEMIGFMELHNMNRTDTVAMRLKNEFQIRKIIAYSKKRYIADTVELSKNSRKVEIRGIEGRRATNKFVLDIVTHLQKYIQQEDGNVNLKHIFYDVFKKLEDAFVKFNVDYISAPINPPKSFSDLKSIQSPARGMINFDFLVSDVFSKIYVKGKHIPILISEEALATNKKLRKKCDDIIKKYESYESVKLKRTKKDTDESFISKTIKDLTIPEIMMNTATINDIINLGIRIDYTKILEVFFKKFGNLFSPMFPHDSEFKFLAECERAYKRIIETHYNV